MRSNNLNQELPTMATRSPAPLFRWVAAFAPLFLAFFALTLTSCEDDAADDIKDGVEDAADSVGDAVDDAGDAVDDAVDDAGDAIDDATDGH